MSVFASASSRKFRRRRHGLWPLHVRDGVITDFTELPPFLFSPCSVAVDGLRAAGWLWTWALVKRWSLLSLGCGDWSTLEQGLLYALAWRWPGDPPHPKSEQTGILAAWGSSLLCFPSLLAQLQGPGSRRLNPHHPRPFTLLCSVCVVGQACRPGGLLGISWWYSGLWLMGIVRGLTGLPTLPGSNQ